jgi:hypothetical protein
MVEFGSYQLLLVACISCGVSKAQRSENSLQGHKSDSHTVMDPFIKMVSKITTDIPRLAR